MQVVYIRWVKDQQMHHSFNVLVLNILLHVSAFQNAIIRDSDMNMLRWCPMSWKQRRMAAVYCDRRRNGLDITGWRIPICHNIQLPSFSAFHDIGHHLSMFISESLMMAFWNAETCRSILSTTALFYRFHYVVLVRINYVLEDTV
jgi:hypothetical protein